MPAAYRKADVTMLLLRTTHDLRIIRRTVLTAIFVTQAILGSTCESTEVAVYPGETVWDHTGEFYAILERMEGREFKESEGPVRASVVRASTPIHTSARNRTLPFRYVKVPCSNSPEAICYRVVDDISPDPNDRLLLTMGLDEPPSATLFSHRHRIVVFGYRCVSRDMTCLTMLNWESGTRKDILLKDLLRDEDLALLPSSSKTKRCWLADMSLGDHGDSLLLSCFAHYDGFVAPEALGLPFDRSMITISLKSLKPVIEDVDSALSRCLRADDVTTIADAIETAVRFRRRGLIPQLQELGSSGNELLQRTAQDAVLKLSSQK